MSASNSNNLALLLLIGLLRSRAVDLLYIHPLQATKWVCVKCSPSVEVGSSCSMSCGWIYAFVGALAGLWRAEISPYLLLFSFLKLKFVNIDHTMENTHHTIENVLGNVFELVLGKKFRLWQGDSRKVYMVQYSMVSLYCVPLYSRLFFL